MHKWYYFWAIFIIITCIFLFTITYFYKRFLTIPTKKRNPFDRLNNSEKQLMEYKKLNFEEKLTEFEILRKAVSRLHSILEQAPDSNYERQEALNWDYLHTDIYIIPYLNAERELSYISLAEACELSFPTEKYKVIDPSNGHIQFVKEGINTFSKIVAINYSLESICNRWLQEITAIREIIS